MPRQVSTLKQLNEQQKIMHQRNFVKWTSIVNFIISQVEKNTISPKDLAITLSNINQAAKEFSPKYRARINTSLKALQCVIEYKDTRAFPETTLNLRQEQKSEPGSTIISSAEALPKQSIFHYSPSEMNKATSVPALTRKL